MERNSIWEKINNQELFGGAAALVIFGCIRCLTFRLPAKVSAYPVFMSNVALFLAVLLFLRCLYRLKRGTLRPKKMFEADGGARTRCFLASALLPAYAAAFRYLGVILSSFVFMLLFTWLFGERGRGSLKVGVLASVGFTAMIYAVFKLFLGIPLPTLIL